MYRISLIFSLFLASCSPQARLSNLLKRHPELVKTNTVYRKDTIIVHGATTDTVFRTQVTKDTVIIRENNLTVKYYNDGKTIYLKGKCDTVRIIREVPYQVNTIEATPETFWEKAWRKTKDFLIILMLGAILILVIFKKFLK